MRCVELTAESTLPGKSALSSGPSSGDAIRLRSKVVSMLLLQLSAEVLMPAGPQIDDIPSKRTSGLRLVAVVVLVLVTAYTIAVVRGLPKDNRIDAATLGIIGIGILAAIIALRPDIFEHVTRLEVAGWKVEIEKRQE